MLSGMDILYFEHTIYAICMSVIGEWKGRDTEKLQEYLIRTLDPPSILNGPGQESMTMEVEA